ncbi:neutral zinc metallopeptidase [Paenarthrobacter sp. DKR-5]|uniref:KPN_02809 family neutral zinc metallopeptidase n=1 Tax=Paenarthrobacter sp. DKR-5 TaxID=2835535 RepID=UPI001BDC6DA3|nr:neutral zinc metallopeptidase [Paenarthrobacter sp. DKR-5]MBT1001843.1 neutral zinc metallopeptidase [Paenarthrobacter sp. DKR-5]
MSFNDNAQLDPSQLEDRRGSGLGLRVGGGIGGGIVLLLAALFGINPQLLEGLAGGGPAAAPATSGAASECRTGSQADQRLDCRIVGTVNSLNSFWPAYLAQQNVRYARPKTVIFSQQVSTGCGTASSEVGPFYCPVDTTAYFDPGFFNELVTRFGSSGGPLAQEYVVAHEFGHHIQNLLGNINKSQQDPQGANSLSVRTELQADCYAGIWAKYASTRKDANGQVLLEPVTRQDLADALSAASSVGDDRIQKAATGRTNPESWTHGSSAERQAWFSQGYSKGTLGSCNTFGAADLTRP